MTATAKIRTIPRSDFVTETERPWMELVEAVGIMATRDRLVEAGVSPASKAASMAVWLRDQVDRRRSVDGETARNYRRALDKIGRSIPGYLNRAAP